LGREQAPGYDREIPRQFGFAAFRATKSIEMILAKKKAAVGRLKG